MSLYISEDMNLKWTGASDDEAGTYLNTATVTAQVKTSAGVAVGSPVTLSYVTSSDGNYLGILDAAVTATLTENAQYRIEYTLTQGNYNGFRRILERAQYRGQN